MTTSKILFGISFGLMVLNFVNLFLILLGVDLYKYYYGTARFIGRILYRLPYFLLKKFLIALPWIISALAALTFGFFGLARQFFHAEDAKIFLERQLPPGSREKTFSLLTIELMIIFHTEILTMLADKIRALKIFISLAYNDK